MTAVEFLLNLNIGVDEQGKDVKLTNVLDVNQIQQAKEMEKEQSIYKLFVGFQEWHQNEYGGKYVEIDQFNEYLKTFKSE